MRTGGIRSRNGDCFKAGADCAALLHLIFYLCGDLDFRHIVAEEGNDSREGFVRYALSRFDFFDFVLILMFGKRAHRRADRHKFNRRKLFFDSFQLGNGHKVVLKADCFYPLFCDYIAHFLKAFTR